MKPRNFPARKLARQISADVRDSSGSTHLSARTLYREDAPRGGSLSHALAQRTKKNRGQR